MENSTGRLEAFSDGVFSIAITLLAFQLAVPKIEGSLSDTTLIAHFFKNWLAHFAYVLSFFSVLIMWLNHHAMFRHIQKSSPSIMFANGFMLMLVAAVPYPTSILSTYFDTPASKSAVAIYAGFFILISIAYNWLWYAATSKGGSYLKPGTRRATVIYFRRAFLLGFPVYLLAFAMAFVHAATALTICALLWIFWAVAFAVHSAASKRIARTLENDPAPGLTGE